MILNYIQLKMRKTVLLLNAGIEQAKMRKFFQNKAPVIFRHLTWIRHLIFWDIFRHLTL